MDIWTVNHRPDDVPMVFVARKWWRGGRPEAAVETLSSASLDTLRDDLRHRRRAG